MKKISKLLVVGVLFIYSLVGLWMYEKTARGAVQDYLNQYRNLSANVISDMDTVIDNEKFNR